MAVGCPQDILNCVIAHAAAMHHGIHLHCEQSLSRRSPNCEVNQAKFYVANEHSNLYDILKLLNTKIDRVS